jgi:hypothetical protein
LIDFIAKPVNPPLIVRVASYIEMQRSLKYLINPLLKRPMSFSNKMPVSTILLSFVLNIEVKVLSPLERNTSTVHAL